MTFSVMQGKSCSTRLVCPHLVLLLLATISCLGPLQHDLDWSEGVIAFVSNHRAEEPRGVLHLLSTNGDCVQIAGTESTLLDPPAWSPDGRMLAFEDVLTQGIDRTDYRYGMEGIMLLDIWGRSTIFRSCAYSPAWSPDGSYVAFYRDCLGSASLNVARTDGTDERELVSSMARRVTKDNLIQQFRISWSPDDQHIVYDNPDTTGQWYIWVVNIEGGTPERLTQGRHPAWSPNGEEIAFDLGGDIWFISVDSGIESKLVLSGSTLYAEWPTWSPDGLQLAFVGGQGSSAEIYIVNRDGTGIDRLTDNSVWDGFPAWRPRLNK